MTEKQRQEIETLRLRRDWAERKLNQFEDRNQGRSDPRYSELFDRFIDASKRLDEAVVAACGRKAA